MNMKKIICLFGLMTLAACGIASTSRPARFYAITTPHVDQVRGPTAPVNVVVDSVSVPQSVDRPQIVIKAHNSNMMNVYEFDRWVEGLNTALPVAISENINMYAKNINARPGRNAAIASNAKYVITIDFVRFDTEMNGEINMSAWWTVANNRGDVLVQKKTNLVDKTPMMDADTPDYDAIVGAQSKLIAKLSYKIADVISELK